MLKIFSDRVALITGVIDEFTSFPSSINSFLICIGTFKYFFFSGNLRNRIWQFWDANHTASGFLWTHPSIARLVLGQPIRTVSDVEKHVGKLRVRYATPVRGQQLLRAERAILFAYVNAFGEAPPLNLSLARRWEATPTSQDLRWAEKGILHRA